MMTTIPSLQFRSGRTLGKHASFNPLSIKKVLSFL